VSLVGITSPDDRPLGFNLGCELRGKKRVNYAQRTAGGDPTKKNGVKNKVFKTPARALLGADGEVHDPF